MNHGSIENWRVLLIDDDDDDYCLTRSMLNRAQGRKIELEWASTFEKGLKLLQSKHYDAVLVDYDLGAHTDIQLIWETAASGKNFPTIL